VVNLKLFNQQREHRAIWSIETFDHFLHIFGQLKTTELL